MSKKNKSEKKTSQAPSVRGSFTPLRIGFIAAGVALSVAAVFFISRPDSGGGGQRLPGQLIETRPVLPYSQFSGKTATAYRYAAETPEVVDRQFCYCYCEKSFGHKTLLTCFTDDHGAKCGICQNEVLRAHELLQKGMSMEEIKKAIDAEFSKSKHS